MSVEAASGDLSEVYAASVQKKALDQQKVQGNQALQLLESAQSAQTGQQGRPLPPDATFSTRV